MELRLKPISQNIYPKVGFLIKSANVNDWINQLNALDINLEKLDCYAVPGSVANTLWGCLVLPHQVDEFIDIGKNTWVRKAFEHLIVSDFTEVFPKATSQEIKTLFNEKITFTHPEIGFFQLTEPIDWAQFISFTTPAIKITTPVEPKESAKKINSFVLKATAPEDAMEALLEKDFPKQEKLKTKPLNVFEKGKLLFYKTLFSRKTKSQANTRGSAGFGGIAGANINPIKLPNWLNNLFSSFFGGAMSRMMNDMEDLEERNKKEVEKLMDMMKNNPENALKYAIPLDESGAARGQVEMGEGLFKLSQIFSSFGLFGSTNTYGGSGGSSINIGDHFYKLRAQYEETAKELIKQKDYKKAAFVYLKLLKNPMLAAETLREGGYYSEAAAIFLQRLNNKQRAAMCYEEGKMYNEAIDLYKSLKLNEKAGDLLMKIGHKSSALKQYEIELNKKIDSKEFYQAGLFAQNKIGSLDKAQELFITGWGNQINSRKCLNQYFNNIVSDDQMLIRAKALSNNLNETNNKYDFVDALTKQIGKREKGEELKDLAYEIIAEQIDGNNRILDHLQNLEPKNTEIRKDLSRFRLNRRLDRKKK
jgi:hypothetical protein